MTSSVTSPASNAFKKAAVTAGAILLTGGIAAPIAAVLIARSAAKGFTETLAEQHNPKQQPQSQHQNLNELSLA